MEDEVIVLCHAPVFSLLMFETARSLHDQVRLKFMWCQVSHEHFLIVHILSLFFHCS